MSGGNRCRTLALAAVVRSFTHKIDYLGAAKYVLPRHWRTCPAPRRKLRRQIKCALVKTKSKSVTDA